MAGIVWEDQITDLSLWHRLKSRCHSLVVMSTSRRRDHAGEFELDASTAFSSAGVHFCAENILDNQSFI
jgi:hypothetical protein